jgi:hypothetical protein
MSGYAGVKKGIAPGAQQTGSVDGTSPSPCHVGSQPALARLRRGLWHPFPGTPGARIVLDESVFGQATASLQERVNRLHGACGCAAGGVAVMGTFAMQMTWWVAGGLGFSGGALLKGIGILAAAAVGGKLAGILGNRVRLFVLLRRLERRLERSPQGPADGTARA